MKCLQIIEIATNKVEQEFDITGKSEGARRTQDGFAIYPRRHKIGKNIKTKQKAYLLQKSAFFIKKMTIKV